MAAVGSNYAIRKLNSGEVPGITATDPGTKMDIPACYGRTGNQLFSSS